MADIGFNNVPSNQRIPGVYPEVEGDIPGQPRQWTLMVGQTVISQPAVPVKVSSVANAVRRFGAGSMLASMVERYLASDPNGTLWVLPLQDFGSTYSVGMTSGSAAITGLPPGLANGMTISGAGISDSARRLSAARSPAVPSGHTRNATRRPGDRHLESVAT